MVERDDLGEIDRTGPWEREDEEESKEEPPPPAADEPDADA